MRGRRRQLLGAVSPQEGESAIGALGSGRNNTRRKAREYKEHCRVMRTTGYVTTSEGTWTTNYAACRISEAAWKASSAK